MKLILALMTALAMTGCATKTIECVTCKHLDQMKAESQAREAKWEAEAKAAAKAAEQEAKRLDAKCAGLSTQPRAMTAQDTSTMEKAVKEVLKDPWSAQFRNVQKASVWSECRYGTAYDGQVNAKNSYGGYGGFKMFIVNKNGGVYISSY